MIAVWNRKDVYQGTDMKQSSKVREILEASGINYRVRVKNRLNQWAGRGTVRSYTGSAGSGRDQYEYTVFVHKKDYEKARFLLSGAGQRAGR